MAQRVPFGAARRADWRSARRAARGVSPFDDGPGVSGGGVDRRGKDEGRQGWPASQRLPRLRGEGGDGGPFASRDGPGVSGGGVAGAARVGRIQGRIPAGARRRGAWGRTWRESGKAAGELGGKESRHAHPRRHAHAHAVHDVGHEVGVRDGRAGEVRGARPRRHTSDRRREAVQSLEPGGASEPVLRTLVPAAHRREPLLILLMLHARFGVRRQRAYRPRGEPAAADHFSCFEWGTVSGL